MVGRRRNQTDAGRRAPTLGDVVTHLEAGQFPAFPRFRSLRHLDLDLVAVREIVGRDSGASRRDLFYGRTSIVAEAHRIFSAFARVRLFPPSVFMATANASCDSLECYQRHGPGDKSFNNLLGGLDVLQLDGGLIQHVGPPPQDASQRRLGVDLVDLAAIRQENVSLLFDLVAACKDTMPIGVFKCTSPPFLK